MLNAELQRPSGVRDIVLQPGQYFVGGAECRVRTLLGSCVSITLWHAKRRVGAMSHFLLGSRIGNAPTLDGRYGAEVLPLMLRRLARLGVEPAQCQAKLFGGGNMFPHQVMAQNAPTVGERNGDVARALLKHKGIEVVSENLFGVGHRQVVFEIATGDVWVRQVPPTDTASIPPEPDRP